jgi:hypothetical protein
MDQDTRQETYAIDEQMPLHPFVARAPLVSVVFSVGPPRVAAERSGWCPCGSALLRRAGDG